MTGHPEIDDILERAHRYHRETFTATGYPPARFLVSEREYEILQSYYGGPEFDCGRRADPGVNDEIQLFGMKVSCSERRAWDPQARFMEHIRIIPIPVTFALMTRPLNSSTDEFIRCGTELPLTPCREITCPCGEVIWDMSTCTAFYVPLGEAIRAACYGGMPRVHCSAPDGSGQDADPLPPLDDLDEGLTCCGRKHATFAEFMAHRRRHEEG